MKTLKILLLILFFAQNFEINAQNADTAQTSISFLKRVGLRFIAKIETDAGIRKGLLYAADSNGIVMLDSLYQKQYYPISTIKSLVIKRKNSFEHGLAKTFLFIEGIGVSAGTLLFIGGIFAGEAAYTLAYAVLIAAYIAPFAVGSAVVIGLASAIIPAIKITKFTPKEYARKFRFINRSTQEYLLKKHPNSKRLVATY
ncbi:hypothetical protein LV89_04573 [Arcicella aurantiaca]|uniref:Superfamily III holin-X n=1 Tax=Arcicella aurantiaca TaxID=591202 RepID=A0A316DIG5_9BACT|nr:hypothetical protein [Arcicella aurantiaca]PWK17019.1 hypothetical protein LV89_04573 [Arcicella aurantiaca]